MYVTDRGGNDEREAMVEAVHRKIDCLDLAEMIASLTKKKFSKYPRAELLLAEETITLLTGNSPGWLSQLIHEYPSDVILRDSKTGSIPPPPEGNSYYDLLPEHIFVQGEGMPDQIKRFLLDNPVILESHLHVSIRQMARKRSLNRFNLRLSYEVAGNGERRVMDSRSAFPLMSVIGRLFSEDDFPTQPILRTISKPSPTCSGSSRPGTFSKFTTSSLPPRNNVLNSSMTISRCSHRRITRSRGLRSTRWRASLESKASTPKRLSHTRTPSLPTLPIHCRLRA